MLASTSPDRALAQEIIGRFYARIGRPAPSFLWFDGPLSCVTALRLFWAFNWLERVQRKGEPIRFLRPRGGQIQGRLWSGLDAHLAREARGRPDPHPRPSAPEFLTWFWGAFWSQLESYVDAPTREHLRNVLQKFYAGDIRSIHASASPIHVEGFWGGALEGASESPSDAGKVARQLDALQRACGWWYPCESAVFCADQPRHVRADAAGRLHAERGPAVYFSNDHAVHVWHGTHVPAAWIEQRDSLDPAIALTWPNFEQRRAAAEIIGWAKVIACLPLRLIDADPDPQIGTLVECDLPDVPSSRFLRVRCGTGREFALSVPREMTSARQANAWTYHLSSEEYQPEARA